MVLLDHDIERFAVQVRANIPEFDQLSEARQHVLLDMAFNLGMNGLLKFRKMLAAIQQGDFEKAADEMLDSKWAKDVKERRAGRLAIMMREDKDFEEVEQIIV
jgi:lysozyme